MNKITDLDLGLGKAEAGNVHVAKPDAGKVEAPSMGRVDAAGSKPEAPTLGHGDVADVGRLNPGSAHSAGPGHIGQTSGVDRAGGGQLGGVGQAGQHDVGQAGGASFAQMGRADHAAAAHVGRADHAGPAGVGHAGGSAPGHAANVGPAGGSVGPAGVAQSGLGGHAGVGQAGGSGVGPAGSGGVGSAGSGGAAGLGQAGSGGVGSGGVGSGGVGSGGVGGVGGVGGGGSSGLGGNGLGNGGVGSGGNGVGQAGGAGSTLGKVGPAGGVHGSPGGVGQSGGPGGAGSPSPVPSGGVGAGGQGVGGAGGNGLGHASGGAHQVQPHQSGGIGSSGGFNQPGQAGGNGVGQVGQGGVGQSGGGGVGQSGGSGVGSLTPKVEGPKWSSPSVDGPKVGQVTPGLGQVEPKIPGLQGLEPGQLFDGGINRFLGRPGGTFGQEDGSTLRLGALPESAVVHKVLGEERISTPYHYRVSVVLAAGSPILEDFAETLVGQAGSLFFTAADNTREIQGIAIAAAIEAVLDEHEVSLSIELVPHLALLGMRVHSRIFQDKTAIEVVKDVFEEWGIEHEIQLGDGYATRAYITQYQETDLAFVERLLASEGVAYYFVHGKTKEKVVLIDDPAGYAATPSKDGGRPTFSWALKDNQTYENIFGVRSERRLRPTAARIGDYDFRKPGLALRSIVLAEDEPAGFVRKFGAEMLSVYRHGDTTEVATGGKLDGEERRARVALGQHRRDIEHMNARTRSRRMIPGHVINLARHPVDRHNREWVVVSTKTTLTRARKQDSDGGSPESFECLFECAPADHLVRPAVPQRTVRQVSETATVVGPKGEAVFPDEHGRVKVKFHWDLSARDDDSASCWLHVSQSWVGANWGSQFVPRVGSEVVVTFLGGDPDRPLVTGSVYNGTHPPPFQLPADVSVSGLRTQSFPGGEGFNELSFDDRSGSERVHLRAERDLDVLAQNDSKLNVGRDHELEVKRDLKETVSGAHSLRVVGGQAVLLEKDSDVQVGGDAMMSVTGNYDLRVSNERVTRVEGTDRADITGEATTVFHSDQIVRVLGHQVTVVGDTDAQRSVSTHVEGTASTYSTGLTEIASETVMVFRVGESAIRMTPKAIEIFAPSIFLQGDKLSGLFEKQVNLHAEKKVNLSSERIHLAGKQAAIDLLENARIDGKQVKLNCTPEPEPEDELKAPKPTTISLFDEDGNPLGHQRFVVVHGDGSQRSGVTSDEGKASVLLDESGQIFFPDVDDARKE